MQMKPVCDLDGDFTIAILKNFQVLYLPTFANFLMEMITYVFL